MMLQISSRLCCCKQLDRVIILRAIVTSSHRAAENKSPSSAIIDLKTKLRMSEGKCHDKSDHSKWASQNPNKVKARVIPSKVNRAVTREQTVGLVERLRVMDQPKLQIKHTPELNQVSDLSVDLSPAGSQIEKNSEIEDDPVENLPRRILTPVKMRIPEGLEKTIEVFRDFPEKYPFLRFGCLCLKLLSNHKELAPGWRCLQWQNLQFHLTSGFPLPPSPKTSWMCFKPGSWPPRLRTPSSSGKSYLDFWKTYHTTLTQSWPQSPTTCPC